jgi:hypothetical protein
MSSSKNNIYDELMKNGGPAFPVVAFSDLHGMTLRDWFAGKAMQGMIGNAANGFFDAKEGDAEAIFTNTAHIAYLIADHMLKARER